MKLLVNVTAILLILPAFSEAATSFHKDKPGNILKPEIAMQNMADGKIIFKCQPVRRGPNINPTVVPGSVPSWHSDISDPIENPLKELSDGKTLQRCDAVIGDPMTGRVRKAK